MTSHRLVLAFDTRVDPRLWRRRWRRYSGGGGGGGPGGSTPTAPGAFSASVRFDGATQRFVATWNVSQGAERYRVQLKRDNVTDFAPLTGAENLSATILDFSFAVGFTIQWSAAALRVEACNAVGCTPATDLPLLPHLAEALASKQILNVPADANELASPLLRMAIRS